MSEELPRVVEVREAEVAPRDLVRVRGARRERQPRAQRAQVVGDELEVAAVGLARVGIGDWGGAG